MAIEDVLSAREAALRCNIERATQAEGVAYSHWRAAVAAREDFERQLRELAKPVAKHRAKGLTEDRWRAAVRKLGTFTTGELATELDVSKPVAKRHLDKMVEEGIVAPDGRYRKSPMFKYQRPVEAGDGFDAQQRLRVVPDFEVPQVVRAGTIAGTGTNADPLNGLVKEVRSVVKAAMKDGWDFQRVGGDHFRLTKTGCKAVPVAGTPRNAGNHATQVATNLRNAHLRAS